MTVRTRLVLLILALGAGFAPDANAVGLSCGDRAAIVERLASDYDETPVSLGMAANGAVIEVHVSPEGETWTLLMSWPTGVACIVATGMQWHDAPPSGAKT